MAGSWRAGVVMMAVVAGCAGALAPAALAQTPAQAPRDGAASAEASPSAKAAGDTSAPTEVASDPIRCWWKTDRTAIRVGERFQLVLTCGVIETTGVTVVPAVNQLEPGAISLTPFEAVSGVRRDDVVAPPWRYLQYEYTMRLLNEGFFGQDVTIPSLTVTYSLQTPGGGAAPSSASGAAASRTGGRDQTYALPPLPMRVLSLVPRAAADIRDASGQTFAAIESRRFRASAAVVVAGIAFAFAGVLAVLAMAGAAGRYRARDPEAVPPLPASTLLGACLRALAQVKADAAREGWTLDLRHRALAPLRIAAAVALGRTVAQDYVDEDAPERAGQLALRTGVWRRRRALVSAAATSPAIAQRLARGRGVGAQARANLEPISEALQVFGAAAYGRAAAEAEGPALDAALEQAVSAIQRVRTSARWPRWPGLRPVTVSGLPSPVFSPDRAQD